ncbi:hypothetical protein V5O48_017201, partial [Marasmius crinis-equi]
MVGYLRPCGNKDVPDVVRIGESAIGSFLNELLIMTLSIVLPELIILWAIRQRQTAGIIAKKYARYGWTRTHALLAIMGELALYDKDDQFRGYLRSSHTFNDDEYQLAEEIELSLSRKSQNNHGRHAIEERYEPLQQKPPEFLSQYTCMLDYALARGVVDLRKSEITESISHGDIFAKLSALLSTGWFWVQIIARKQQGLFITEFEVVILSFTVPSFAAYVLWLDRPQRVRYPIRITWDIKPPRPVAQNSNQQSFLHLDPRLRQKSTEEHGVDLGKRRRSGGERLSLGKRLARGSRAILSGLPGFLLRNQGFYLVTGNDAFVFMCDEQSLNRFRTGLLEGENVGLGWWLALATLTFIVGAVHFISWGSQFPTTFLQVGWRANAILLLAIPVLTDHENFEQRVEQRL